MYAKLADQLQWRAELVVDGRFEDLSREFVFPFVMYQGERQLILDRAEELIKAYVALRASYMARGVVRLATNVTAVDLPRNGRFRVWLRVYEMDARGRCIAQSDVVYYCCETAQGVKTEMAEYGSCCLPEIWETDRENAAQSA
jgi:hypothetical protein